MTRAPARRSRARAQAGEGRPPPRLPRQVDELLGFQLRMAHAAIYRQFLVALEDLDLTPRQYAVLEIVADDPGVSQIDIAGLLVMDRPTMMAIVNRLQARGLIERRASAVDRRRQELHLTPAGSAFLAVAAKRVAAYERRMAERYTREELGVFMELLRRLQT